MEFRKKYWACSKRGKYLQQKKLKEHYLNFGLEKLLDIGLVHKSITLTNSQSNILKFDLKIEGIWMFVFT